MTPREQRDVERQEAEQQRQLATARVSALRKRGEVGCWPKQNSAAPG